MSKMPYLKQALIVILSICVMNIATLMADSLPSHQYTLEELISEEAIAAKIKEVAASIDQEYHGEEVVILGVLKGAICLVADLIREIKGPLSVEFIRCSSYGARGTVRGELTVTGLESLKLEGKNVLVVDDVFDSGTTLATVVNRVLEKNPRTVKSLVLLSKKIPRKIVYQPDYALFEIGENFVVGYGLDYKEFLRGLKGIYDIHLEKRVENIASN